MNVVLILRCARLLRGSPDCRHSDDSPGCPPFRTVCRRASVTPPLVQPTAGRHCRRPATRRRVRKSTRGRVCEDEETKTTRPPVVAPNRSGASNEPGGLDAVCVKARLSACPPMHARRRPPFQGPAAANLPEERRPRTPSRGWNLIFSGGIRPLRPTDLILPSTWPLTPTIVGNPVHLTVRASAGDVVLMGRHDGVTSRRGRPMDCRLHCPAMS